MKALTIVCIASLALVVLATVTEARTSRHHGRHSKKQQEEEPAVSQIQQEEPKPVEITPVVESEEAVEGAAEKSRPARQRKAPVLCNASPAQANVGKPDKQETPGSSSFEIMTPKESVESLEPPSSEEAVNIETPTPVQSKPVKKPKAKVVKASSEESAELDGDDDESDSNISAALESIEEPKAPKALTSVEIPEANSRAVESEEEEKPKARRSKHHRQDVRKVEKPHRRRVVFHSDEDEE